jgi:hypothetical protein
VARQFFQTRIAAGATWPGSDGGANLRPFRWVKIDNRGAVGNDLIVALNENMGIDDGASWYVKIPAGYQRIFNVTGPKGEESVTATEIHVKNIGSGAVPVLIELDTNPIVDQQRGQPGGAATGQTVDLTQWAGLAVNQANDNLDGQGVSGGNPLVVIRPEVFNGATWDRVRAPTSDGNPSTGLAGVQSMLARPDASGIDRAREISQFGDGVGVAQAMQPSSTPSNNSPAANTAAVLTYAAVAGQRHRLTMMMASYSAAPTGGNLLVTDGGAGAFAVDTNAAGPLPPAPMPAGGIQGSVNAAMVITLAAGGAAVTGRVNAAKLTA